MARARRRRVKARPGIGSAEGGSGCAREGEVGVGK
jgi:hypothetical protein